jgi:hypothetical protein
MPSTCAFEAIRSATWIACAVSGNWVSPGTTLNLVL